MSWRRMETENVWMKFVRKEISYSPLSFFLSSFSFLLFFLLSFSLWVSEMSYSPTNDQQVTTGTIRPQYLTNLDQGKKYTFSIDAFSSFVFLWLGVRETIEERERERKEKGEKRWKKKRWETLLVSVDIMIFLFHPLMSSRLERKKTVWRKKKKERERNKKRERKEIGWPSKCTFTRMKITILEAFVFSFVNTVKKWREKIITPGMNDKKKGEEIMKRKRRKLWREKEREGNYDEKEKEDCYCVNNLWCDGQRFFRSNLFQG